MYIVTKVIRLRWLIVFFIGVVFATTLYSENAKAPIEPTEPSVEFEDIEEAGFDDDVDTKKEKQKNRARYIPIKIVITGKKAVIGKLEIKSNIMITITNKISSKQLSIKKFLLNNVDKIEVLRWKQIRTDGAKYSFVPSQYRIYANKTWIYDGNIPYINEFIIVINSKERKFYTIFYDRWVMGKSERFYWKNSRAYSFTYNLTHPIDGVVKALEFYPMSETIVEEKND